MTIEEINNEIINLQKHLDNANRELIRLQRMEGYELDPASVTQIEELTNNISVLVEQLESFIEQIEI